MGLMGIQLRIASKAAVPQEFEMKEESAPAPTPESQPSSTEAPAIEQGGKPDGTS
jgi:hypothetical protein